jgi:plasmid stabilization system protein ParE
MFNVDTDYRYLVVANNYVFYRIEGKCIRIINLYHEKEDFMRHLFGIDTTPK